VSLAGHPDRLRWNDRYGPGYAASFVPHPLAVEALSLGLPDGPVADLACGPSGSALLAAQAGRKVTAVDISEVALGLLDAEARRRGLGDLITVTHADLATLHLAPRHYALVLCTGFWDRTVFADAARSVAPGGVLGWEAFTVAALRARPKLCPDWCLAQGEPASLLPADFGVIRIWDLQAPVLSHEPDRAQSAALRRPRRHNEPGTKRRLLARRMTTSGSGGRVAGRTSG
jgi:SAM-dependent methyltransferase